MMEQSAPPQAAAKAAMPPDTYAQMRADMVEVARGWAGGDGAVRGRRRVPADRRAPARLAAGRTAAAGVPRGRLSPAGPPSPASARCRRSWRRPWQRVRRRPVTLTVAGRTDAGVHARGQVASHAGDPAPARALNGVLPHDVRVLACEEVARGLRRPPRRPDADLPLPRAGGSVARVHERGRSLWWRFPLDRGASARVRRHGGRGARLHRLHAHPDRPHPLPPRRDPLGVGGGGRRACWPSGSRPTRSCATWSGCWWARC